MFIESDDGVRLKWLGALHLWNPEGYADPVRGSGTARVLTPEVSVTALRRGYRPVVQPSAGA